MPFATALELKDLFHNFGVNFKYLPRVYAEVTGKYTKKYVHTVMVAKVVKYYMIESVIEGKRQTKQVPAQIIVEDGYRVIFEGNNSNSSELWKEIALKFKKVYGMPISMS